VSVVGESILVRGEVESAEDLTINGRVEGPIWSEGLAVTVSAAGAVKGDIVARDITVLGTVEGTMMASDVVDVRPSARVTGRVLAPRFILGEGASFNGQVAPQHLDAAMRVARHRREQPETAEAAAPPAHAVRA
jgi:cytoskeletal protein CcmA (bactofilin family)